MKQQTTTEFEFKPSEDKTFTVKVIEGSNGKIISLVSIVSNYSMAGFYDITLPKLIEIKAVMDEAIKYMEGRFEVGEEALDDPKH